MYVFLSYFSDVENLFNNEVAETPCTFLTCHHMLKLTKHIGIVQNSDIKFVNQFSNPLIGLNEHKQAVCWCLTRSTAFSDVQDLLSDLRQTWLMKDIKVQK